MSEFYTSKFKDGAQLSRRITQDMQATTLPATATDATTRSSAPPTPYPSTQHADGENIQAMLWDVDPWDDEHFVWG